MRDAARLLVLICILTAATTRLSLGATVTLRAESEVPAARAITVADVATVQADDRLAERIDAVVVSSSLLPGAKRTIDASYVKLKLSAAGVDKGVEVVGPAKFAVLGQSVTLSAEDLAAKARDYVLGMLTDASRTYDVVVDRAPRNLVLPGGSEVEVRPRLLSRSVRFGSNTVALDAVVDGRVAATTTASLSVSAVADVLVAKAAIPQGEPLTADNTGWEQRDVTRMPDAIVMTAGGEMRERVARRSLSAGTPITNNDVTLPPTVRQGDTVTVVVVCGSVKLRTTAQSKQDGRTGDTVKVRPSISDQDVRARITGPGTVEIDR